MVNLTDIEIIAQIQKEEEKKIRRDGVLDLNNPETIELCSSKRFSLDYAPNIPYKRTDPLR